MRHFSDCLQIRFEQESMVCQCPVSAVPVFPASWLLVSPLCLYCQDLHNNTLRVTASQSSCRPMRLPHGQASPATAGLSLVETPGAGGPRAVGECVELARAHNAGWTQLCRGCLAWPRHTAQASVLPLRSSVLAPVQ